MNVIHPAVAIVNDAESLWCTDAEIAYKRACLIVTRLIDAKMLEGHHRGQFPFAGKDPAASAES